jgi:hypothetical protein
MAALLIDQGVGSDLDFQPQLEIDEAAARR